MQIFINSNNQQSGPFSVDQINQSIWQGILHPAAVMAWYEGLADWIPLNHVPGVVSLPGQPPPIRAQGDATGGVIPYKNPPALFAYYLGIFSLIPVLGFFLGIASFICGIAGLRKRRLNPAVRGSVHAWIGIIIGAVVVALHLFAIYVVIAH